MDKDLRRSDAHSLGEEDTTPYYLPSTFSPWQGSREDFFDNVESNFAHSKSQMSPSASLPSLPSPEMVEEHHHTSGVNENGSRRPSLPRNASNIKLTMAASTQPADEELMLRPPHQGITEVVISAGGSAGGSADDSPPQKRGVLRRTKFKEMLSRSLSSTMLNKNKSSPPTQNYDTIQDETPPPPMDRDMENFPMSQVDTAHRATNHRIYETEDGDSLEHLAEKYGMLYMILGP